MSRHRIVALVTAVLLSAAPLSPIRAQQSTPPPTSGTAQAGAKPQTAPPPEQPAVDLPPSQLDQIKRAVLRDTRLQLRGDPLTFYMTVEAKLPSVKQMLGSYDLKYGPTPGGPPGGAGLHQEYLGMVTPNELFGSAGFRPYELLQGAIVNWLGQMLVRKAINEIREARNEREVQEIRDRIERELAALRGGGS